jgi:phospholipid/cholesterol/gamma-HCH transport system substrate-binding protein
MNRANLDLLSGVLVFFLLAFLAYYSIKLGKIEIFGDGYYRVYARFVSVSGLKNRTDVDIAGVKVGKVIDITLDPKTEEARVCLEISRHVRLRDDVIASISTQGLIGSKYISISPGESERIIPPGGTISNTKSAVDFEQLISQFIQGGV